MKKNISKTFIIPTLSNQDKSVRFLNVTKIFQKTKKPQMILIVILFLKKFLLNHEIRRCVFEPYYILTYMSKEKVCGVYKNNDKINEGMFNCQSKQKMDVLKYIHSLSFRGLKVIVLSKPFCNTFFASAIWFQEISYFFLYLYL